MAIIKMGDSTNIRRDGIPVKSSFITHAISSGYSVVKKDRPVQTVMIVGNIR